MHKQKVTKVGSQKLRFSRADYKMGFIMWPRAEETIMGKGFWEASGTYPEKINPSTPFPRLPGPPPAELPALLFERLIKANRWEKERSELSRWQPSP